MTPLKSVSGFLAVLSFCVVGLSSARASDVTYTGMFAADNSVATINLDPTSSQNYTFFTTSYAGGMNLNGTTSSAGGFVPVLTLFSVSTGDVVGFGGGGGTCGGPAKADPTTGLCDDADFSATLGPGKYVLDLTEFPNVASGGLADGFLFSSDPTATGDFCGVSGGTFLETDRSSCPQRDASYAVNVSSSAITPELPTWFLVFPPAAAFLLLGRRHFA